MRISADRMDEIIDYAKGYAHASIERRVEIDACKAKIREIYRSRSPIEPETYYGWIGINPPPNSINIADLYDFTLANLPYEKYAFCVEQHTENGIRPHIHALVKTNGNTRAGHQITRLAKIYDISNNYIEYSISNKFELNKTRFSYIIGEKTPNKLQYVELDRKTRELLNIPQYYSIL